MKRIPARFAALVAAALVVPSLVTPLGLPAAAAADPGRLSGVVRDETGAVLAGADVRLSTPSGPVAASGTSGAEGHYEIAVAEGLYDITVAVTDATGPWTAHVRNMPVWSDTPLDLSVVRPAGPEPLVHEDPASAFGADGTGETPTGDETGDTGDETGGTGTGEPVVWHGRVLGSEGDPVEPRSLRLDPAAGAPAGTLETGPDGTFDFTGPAGPYDLALEIGPDEWGGGSTSAPGDGAVFTAPVDLTADRSDALTLPAAGTVDVVVAEIDGRKGTGPLAYTAEAVDGQELAAGVTARVTVRDTVPADDNAHFDPWLFGPSVVTLAVPADPAPRPVIVTVEPRDRLAVVLGDRRTPPGPPRQVTAIAGDGKVKVSWDPPASDGGAPVTDYVVTASRGASHFRGTFPATAGSGTIRNLVNGSYDVTVSARNTKGAGPASAPVAVTIGPAESPPSPPPADGPSGDDSLGGAGSGGGSATPPPGSGRSGYWLLGSDGAVYAFGDAALLGDASAALAAATTLNPAGDLATGGTNPGSTAAGETAHPAPRAVDLEAAPSGRGYWILDSGGRVHPFGDAPHLGDVPTARLSAGEKPASLSATPTGAGYWIFTDRGRALPFGDAAALGDLSGLPLNGPVTDSVATPSGRGYYMVAADGGIFAFGDAGFAGSMGGRALNAPVRSLVPDGNGAGYWLVAADGGVFAFEAPFRGSMGGQRLNRPVRGMVRYGNGYVMVGEDGGVFSFSDRRFTGSLGARPPATPIVAVAALG